jgi:hypothetical protein
MNVNEINEALRELESNGEIHMWEENYTRNMWLVRENEGDKGMILNKDTAEDYITMMK